MGKVKELLMDNNEREQDLLIAELDHENRLMRARNERLERELSEMKRKEALAEQEPVAMRYDFDGYGWKYIDSGSGSDWQTRIKDAEPIYTTPPQRTWVVFPTMLRKMWSGSEVQAWLDENVNKENT